jgi:hypothetical protein
MSGRCGAPWDDVVKPGFVTALTNRYATPMDKGFACGVEFANRDVWLGRAHEVVAQPPSRAVRRSEGLLFRTAPLEHE